MRHRCDPLFVGRMPRNETTGRGDLRPVRATIGGRLMSAKRAYVRPFEAAFVLGLTEAQVVGMLRRGELRDASPDRWRRIDADELSDLVRDRVRRGLLSPLSPYALGELVCGRLKAPRRADPDRPPPTVASELQSTRRGGAPTVPEDA